MEASTAGAWQDNPKISATLMNLTYLVGAIGLVIGFSTVKDDPATLSLAALLGVGATGVLSFLRHSVFNRSDAVRMGWDLGQRNNFQIEVGLANLAWGLIAIFAVALDWGLVAEAASFLAFGFYLDVVALMLIFSPGESRRSWPAVIAMATFGVGLTVVGLMGMAA